MPLMLAYEKQADRLDALLSDGQAADESTVAGVLKVVRDSGAIKTALDAADRYAVEAASRLESFPRGQARDCLAGLATFVVERKL
jgi:geranylgeranyl pyrophosphate synthase